MASFQISPPEKFDFSRPEEWPKWFRRFERFQVASNLTEKSEIYSMGHAADDILITLGLTAENKKKYKPVTEKFTDHFVKKRNTIFERAKFN